MPTQARSLRPPPLPVLLDQQLWFLGQDIRHRDGNGLERFGFRRLRSPDGTGTSCYVLPTGDMEALVCWGFALYVGAVVTGEPRFGGQRDTGGDGPSAGGVLWRRHTRAPRLVTAPLTLPLHRLTDLPREQVAHSPEAQARLRQGLQSLAHFFVRYEHWAADALGGPHRLAALAQLPRHKRRRFAPLPELTWCWRDAVQ